MGPVRRHEGDYYGTTSDRVFRFVPLYVDTEKMIHKNPSGRGKCCHPHTKPLWPRYRFLVTYVPRRLLRSSCLPFIRSAHPSSNSMLQVCLVFVLPRKQKGPIASTRYPKE